MSNWKRIRRDIYELIFENGGYIHIQEMKGGYYILAKMCAGYKIETTTQDIKEVQLQALHLMLKKLEAKRSMIEEQIKILEKELSKTDE